MEERISFRARWARTGGSRDRDLLFGIKGDALKENARIALENGYDVVNPGVARWKNV